MHYRLLSWKKSIIYLQSDEDIDASQVWYRRQLVFVQQPKNVSKIDIDLDTINKIWLFAM